MPVVDLLGIENDNKGLKRKHIAVRMGSLPFGRQVGMTATAVTLFLGLIIGISKPDSKKEK